MKCSELTGLLTAYLDGEINAEELRLVEKHLSECETCRQELFLLRETQSCLREVLKMSAAGIEPSPAAWNTVREKIKTPVTFWERLSGFFNNTGVRMAVPVALLLVLATGLIWKAGTFTKYPVISETAEPSKNSPVVTSNSTAAPSRPPMSSPVKPAQSAPPPAPSYSPAAPAAPQGMSGPAAPVKPPAAPAVTPPPAQVTLPPVTNNVTVPAPVVNVAPDQVTVQPPNVTANQPEHPAAYYLLAAICLMLIVPVVLLVRKSRIP